MSAKQKVIAQTVQAFAAVRYPGDWCLRGSNEGNEPYLVEQEFKGKTDWQALDSDFLDQAPGGYGSALSFFSDEAFHFYLPAYMIADINGPMQHSDPVYHLTHGLDDTSRYRCINPNRYGERTWFDLAQYKFSIFNRQESAAIVAFLSLRRDEEGEHQGNNIDQALNNFWYAKGA